MERLGTIVSNKESRVTLKPSVTSKRSKMSIPFTSKVFNLVVVHVFQLYVLMLINHRLVYDPWRYKCISRHTRSP